MSGDGLWLKRSSKGPRTTRQLLNQNAIRALFWIIMTSVLGIIALSMLSALLQADLLAGLFAGVEQNPDAFAAADEALSVLGNIASASVGGLVGWLTRDILDKPEETQEPSDE